MDSLLGELWEALDRILPFLSEPWSQIIGVGVPVLLIVLVFIILVRLVIQPAPKNSPSLLSEAIRKLIGEISHFMRHVLPTRLDSPMAAQGTEAVTKELLDVITELRKLKVQMSKKQSERTEEFIDKVVGGVNQLINTIKTQAELSAPNMEVVNSTLEEIVTEIDDTGAKLINVFD